MLENELKIGIVGCGGISRMHVAAYKQVEGARIVKVFDVHRPSAEALAAELGAEVADSLEDMARRDTLDAVSVCTPPGTHLETCSTLLGGGVAVLCEKPFEIDAERARALAAAIRSSDATFMPAFCHRFHPEIIETRRLLKEEPELVGEPLFFRCLFGGKIEIGHGHRSDPKMAGGGALIDNCAHSLDLFRFLVSDIASVQGHTANLVQQMRVEDFGGIQVTGVTGAVGQVVSSYSLPMAYNSVELFCSRGTITVNYWVPGRPSMVVVLESEGKERGVAVQGLDRFAGEVTYFLDCVAHGKEPSPGVDDALANALAIEAAYRSAREGRSVSP